MVLDNKKRQELYKVISEYLEDNSLEDLVINADIEPADVVLYLYESGQLDPEYLADMIGIDIV